MATIVIDEHKKNESGTYDEVRRITEARLVKTGGGSTVEAELQQKLPTSHNTADDAHANMGWIKQDVIGQPHGIAGLDDSGKVSESQLPLMNYDPAGTATSVVASHNIAPDAHSDIRTKADGALQASGGTMTGDITFGVGAGIKNGIVFRDNGCIIFVPNPSTTGGTRDIYMTTDGKIVINGPEGAPQTITNVKSPVSATDVANKQYVDKQKPYRQSITLDMNAWVDNVQTVTVNGVLADESKQLIQIAPKVATQQKYFECGVRCTNQGENTLTFTANKKPNSALWLFVTIQEVQP